MSKILTVFGATGNQGGSVIRSVLAHPTLSKTYKIRAVTRDTSKEAAQKLTQQGIEVISADASDKSSVARAVQGAFAVYSMTDFWAQMSKDVEIEQGKTIADASKAAGVKHLIYASLPHVTRLTNGQLKHVVHFDGKADVAEYIESIKGSEMTTSYFEPAFYISNFSTMIQPANKDTGEFTVMLPWGQGDQSIVPVIDIAKDTGTYVAAILASDSANVNGKFYQGVSEWITPNQVAATLSKSTGKTFKYSDIDPEVWAGFLPATVATEFKENMILIRDHSYYGKGSEKKQAEQDKSLGITIKSSISEWVKEGNHWQ